MNMRVNIATESREEAHGDFTHTRMASGARPFEIRNRLLVDDGDVDDVAADKSITNYEPQQVLATKPKAVFYSNEQDGRLTFKNLASWEGIVARVGAESFVAVIRDQLQRNEPPEEVELAISELSETEAEFLKPGAVFYWNIGYKDGRGVPRQRFSTIRMRRLPPMSSKEIEAVKQKAAELLDIFCD